MISIPNFINQVQQGNIDPVRNIHKVLEEAKKIDQNYNYFTTISEELAIKQAEQLKKNPKGKLAGLPISVKDAICVKDVESAAGSRILKGYNPPFNATIIEKIIKEGGIIIGKTTQDEFGFGAFSVNTEKIPKNPFNKERTTGGSSGGSAGVTQRLDMPHISLGESTGGSIAEPSAFCGVAGLTPTYGLVSRYGLIDYSSSMDKIGPIAQEPRDTFLLLDVIKGKDKKDPTTVNQEKKSPEIKKVAIIKEALDACSPEIARLITSKIENYDTVSLPNTIKFSLAAYYFIGTAEASSNLAKFCGLRYGKTEQLQGTFSEYFTKVRSKQFQKESKRRIILGTFARMAGFRNAYYVKAMKVRTLLINEYQKAFKKYDVLISPTTPTIAPKFEEIEKMTPLENYKMDILTVGPNLAGLPHISINAGSVQQMPVGIMAIANHLEEQKLKEISQKIKR